MHGEIFVLSIIGIAAAGRAFRTWTQARHGYPITDRKGRAVSRDDALTPDRQAQLLQSENERLNGQVSRLEERIAVLERIATDPAERTAREIEALRDR